MKTKFVLLLIGLLFFTAACAPKSPEPLLVRAGESFELRPAEDLKIAKLEGGHTLRLMSVKDSRCPRVVQCVHAGWVELGFEISLADGSEEKFVLRFGAGVNEESQRLAGIYQLQVLAVDPYPGIPKTDKPEAEIVKLRLEKLP